MWWWIKGDACDLVPGLCESVKGMWSGDVDLNDGILQKSYKAYIKRLEEINEMVLTQTEDQVASATVVHQLTTCREAVENDVHFLHAGKQTPYTLFALQQLYTDFL